MAKESELAACVRHMLDKYFRDLDGEDTTGVYDMVIGAVEKPLIAYVVHHSEGNQTRAAGILGINRNTLKKKIIQHRLD